ncbi:hypothetical protein GCM10007416_31850 [Kroppenstedtia guangzhouensis]|uniref:Lipoprotein n=1 Tax=Kroppenstedtia guangzhouensis TaxID=1274356 RepID=A0ABQ1H3H5_9BACL|nr:hypothetical protein [Kroppenstedtia guangzhouensis]GGA56270.1 hypothetical protein GCM10007416_31850 [Kroppenstedtia guangzhouensis]
MNKRYGSIMAVAVIAMVLLLSGCSEGGSQGDGAKEAGKSKKERDLEAADKAVYEWIAGTVEGDDDRQSKVLLKKEVKKLKEIDVLEPGNVSFPGAEKKMGEQYLIERYDKYYEDEKLFYRIKYYHPNNDELFTEHLLMEKENGKWKSTDYRGESSEFYRLFPERKNVLKAEEVGGVTVHEMEEEK